MVCCPGLRAAYGNSSAQQFTPRVADAKPELKMPTLRGAFVGQLLIFEICMHQLRGSDDATGHVKQSVYGVGRSSNPRVSTAVLEPPARSA